MISFMPLSESRGADIADELQDCDELAWALGRCVGENHGTPVLMYGRRAGRTLVEARRGTSFFASCKPGAPREASATLPLDFGMPRADGADGASAPPLLPQRCGVTVIGVQPYVTNFNVQVAGASLAECKAAAAALRSEMGVQVMALPHESSSTVEIGCNLQATDSSNSPPREQVLALIESRLPGGSVVHHSYVIGLTPGQALEKGAAALAAH